MKIKQPKFPKEQKELAARRVQYAKATKMYQAALKAYETAEMAEENAEYALFQMYERYVDTLNKPWKRKKQKRGDVYARYYLQSSTDYRPISKVIYPVAMSWKVFDLPTNFKSKAAAEKSARKLLASPKNGTCDAFKAELAKLIRKYQK